jgi:hypothetical protein
VSAWNAMAGGPIGGGDRRPATASSGWGFAGSWLKFWGKRKERISGREL